MRSNRSKTTPKDNDNMLTKTKKCDIMKKALKRRSGVKPVTPADFALSEKHLKDSIHFNAAHAKEHIKNATEDIHLLNQRIKSSGA